MDSRNDTPPGRRDANPNEKCDARSEHEKMESEIMPRTTLTCSSSSSLFEPSSGVASEGMLKKCGNAVVENETSADADSASSSCCSDDYDIIERESSTNDSDESPRENLGDAYNSGFKDPFPTLTPIPNSTRRSLQSSFYNRLNAEQTASQSHMREQSSHQRNQQNCIRPIQRSHSRSSATAPPCTPYAPRTPPISRPTTPQPIQTSPITKTSPVRTAWGNVGKIWLDPFPTPDVSVHSSRYSSPCSSRIKDDHDEDRDGNVILDWETVMQAVPNIPSIEELSISEDGQRSLKNSSVATIPSAHRNISCPRLRSLEVADSSVRKVASESNLRLIKRPSLENIWGALKSGPDGNELVAKYDDPSWGRKKQKRRNSEKATIWREPIECHDRQRDNPLHCSLLGQEQMFERTNTAPAETPWEGIHSPLFAPSAKFGNNNIKHNGSNNNRNLQKQNSATITNVTGASLAQEVKMIIDQREGTHTTPNRLSFRAWRSRAIVSAKNSAGELVFSPVRTVGNIYRTKSQNVVKLVRNTREKLKERKERRRQRRLARMREPPRSWWIVIPADHPYKIAWDVLTMVWALMGAYRTHTRIRDRVFDQSPLIILTEVWFTLDVLLNFVTEHKTRKGEVIRDGKAIWARYLTTWFIIDILSLIPWERIYVRPVVEKIKRRNIFQKTFFRSKAVVRVSRVLRGRHIKLFGRVSKQTGTPLRRLVTLVIYYLPKYLVFLRNMKGALVVRALRFVHWLHNMYKKIWVKARNARMNLAARRAARRAARVAHPIFELRDESSEHNDSETETDDSEEEEESSGSDDDDDGDYNESDDSPLTSYHRTQSEGSPLVALRGRSFSQSAASPQNQNAVFAELRR